MCRSSVTARSPSRNEASRPPMVSSSSRHAAVDSWVLSVMLRLPLAPVLARPSLRSSLALVSCADSFHDQGGGALHPGVVEGLIAGDNRHQRHACDGLDQVGGGYVGSDLAALSRVVEMLRHAEGGDIAESVEKLRVQRRVG